MNPTVNIEMVKMSELPQFMQDSLNRAKDQLKIRYEDPEFQSLSINENGDWIDLRAAKDYYLEAGKKYMINLGVAMRLPEGYEAHLAPRSSTFKNWGIIQTNGVGVIDNSFSGNDDIWHMPVYATEDARILKGDRVAEFRLMPTMRTMLAKAFPYQPTFGGKFYIVEVDDLGSANRGGFGSTGVK